MTGILMAAGHRIEYTATVSKRVVLHATDSNGCTSEVVVEVTVRDTCPCRNLISPHPKSMLCGDHDSLYLEGKSGYKRYSWNTGNHDRTILVKTAGWYKIEVMDSNGNVLPRQYSYHKKQYYHNLLFQPILHLQ